MTEVMLESMLSGRKSDIRTEGKAATQRTEHAAPLVDERVKDVEGLGVLAWMPVSISPISCSRAGMRDSCNARSFEESCYCRSCAYGCSGAATASLSGGPAEGYNYQY